MTASHRVLLAGGYGVVGTLVAGLLRKHHPELRFVIGGRNQAKAAAAASTLGNAEPLVMDISKPDPLAAAGDVSAVIGLVHDPDDHLLRAAIRRGVAYADITRGLEAQVAAFATAALETPRAPVLLSSNWMAGVPAILAAAAAREFSAVERVELSILFDRNDKTGPDSAGAGAGLDERFTVRTGGAWRMVPPMSAPQRVTFPSGRTRIVSRMSMADVVTLAQATGAKDVLVRIGLDSDGATRAMRFLIKTRLWGLVERLSRGKTPAHNPKAAGAAHEIVIALSGTREGKPHERQINLLDRQGQAHLTAIGALVAVERILGLDGQSALRPGLALPETAPHEVRLRALLRQEGVDVT